jgi:hypothetical protein
MEPFDDPPIDSRRWRRWAEPPPRRGERRRDAVLTPAVAIAAHGGELAFWLAWLRGELDADVQTWFRRCAENDAALADDLHSIEQPHAGGFSTRAARLEIRNALETLNYVTEAPSGADGSLPSLLANPEDGPTETDLLVSGSTAERGTEKVRSANPAELRRRLRSGLFALLEEVEIRVPSAEEVREGSRLLEELVGLPAISRFLLLHQLHLRCGSSPPSLRQRLLRELAPPLFAGEPGRPRWRLSFRLFVRARLQHACRRRGWLPAGPRYRDLSSAFAALSRERIGTLVRGVLAAHELFQAAGLPCRQLAALLEAVP